MLFSLIALFPQILIGNKCDVSDSARVVSFAEGQALAKEYGMEFFECSAKKDIGVTQAFQSIATQVVERYRKSQGNGAGNNKSTVKVRQKSTKEESKGCC